MKKVLYLNSKKFVGIMKPFHDVMKEHCDYLVYNHFDKMEDFMKVYNEFQPDVLIIHHNRRFFTNEIHERFKNSYQVYWYNDERQPLDDNISSLAGFVDLFLVSSDNTVDAFKALGTDAEYFLMGCAPFDPGSFENRERKIVFTGQNCQKKRFDLSDLRENYIKALSIHPAFELYGKGWDGLEVKGHMQHTVYLETEIGLSIGHMNTSRTHSNRMLQIMAKGAMCLSYETYGIGRVFKHGVHFDSFASYEEMIAKLRYYLLNSKERIEIAKAGHKYVIENYSWKAKARSLVKLLSKRKVL